MIEIKSEGEVVEGSEVVAPEVPTDMPTDAPAEEAAHVEETV